MSPEVPSSPPVAERTAHPFLTYDMIQEIPQAVRETLRRNGAPASAAAELLADRRFLFYTGCGTASYAAMLAERVATAAGGRPRSIALPASELSSNPGRVDPNCGVLGVSHSGITKATVDAMRSAKDRSARTVGVTHFAGRPLAAVSDRLLVVGNGPDRSRCHTKCFVAGALGAAMVGRAWEDLSARGPHASLEAWQSRVASLPPLQEVVLREVESASKELASTHLRRRATFIVGSGPNEPVAFEAALKLKETSFIAAEGLETEQMLHGPWQALDAESLVFVVVGTGPGRGRALDLLRAVRVLGGHAIAVAEERDREVAAASEAVLPVPPVDEFLSPFVNIIPLYLYAYHASVARGHNPDVLRYLEPRYWAAREIVFPPGTH